MQSNQDQPNFLFQTQPSFNFDSHGLSFLQPEFGNMSLEEKKPPPKPNARINTVYRRKIKKLELRVKELERELKLARRSRRSSLSMQENCHNQFSNPLLLRQETQKTNDPNSNCLADIQQQQEAIAEILMNQNHSLNTSGNNLQFEQFVMTPNPPSEEQPDLNGQSWIVMGMLMMVMGININGYDGSIDAYKITRETVDSIRKQVQKSAEEIVFPVFYSKLFSIEGAVGMESGPLDGCFELEGLRLESINEEDLMFEEHLNFKLKYEALIVMMEYMKQYSSMT